MPQQTEEQPGRNRVVVTLSDFDYQELRKLSEGKGQPMGTLARGELERWIGSPAFASLLKRVADHQSE